MSKIRYSIDKIDEGLFRLNSIVDTNFGGPAVNFICEGDYDFCMQTERAMRKLDARSEGKDESMVSITEKEFKQFQALKKMFLHLNAERTGLYFICGSTEGDEDSDGLPKGIAVCPQMGADYSVMYWRQDKKGSKE